ncbi:MAG: hypothetical protein Q8R76_03615 [Candidatus Omnitrophota bacterium]|nr:hypothetical protein [Candidatus Omnitrophota bacterium]
MNSRIDTKYQVDGTVEKYYVFGKLNAERHYVNDELNGLSTIFYSDGSIKSEWNFKDGQKDGIGKQYSQDGLLVVEEDYDKGRKIMRRTFDAAGNATSVKQFE